MDTKILLLKHPLHLIFVFKGSGGDSGYHGGLRVKLKNVQSSERTKTRKAIYVFYCFVYICTSHVLFKVKGNCLRIPFCKVCVICIPTIASP